MYPALRAAAVIFLTALPALAQQPVTVSASVSPLPQPHSPVHIAQIRYVVHPYKQGLALELENATSVPVIAVYLQYDIFAPAECTADKANDVSRSLDGASDARRFPGMISIDIPEHGRVWFTDDVVFPLIADALHSAKSRYIRVSAKVLFVAFADGTRSKNRWRDGTRQRRTDNDAAICANWQWNLSPQDVDIENLGMTMINGHALHAPGVAHGSAGNGVTYTCVVTAKQLVCPDDGDAVPSGSKGH